MKLTIHVADLWCQMLPVSGVRIRYMQDLKHAETTYMSYSTYIMPDMPSNNINT